MIDLDNSTNGMLPDLSGSILPPDLFGSALANFSGLFDNSSYIVPTLTSSKYNITELSEYPSSSSSVLPKVPNATTTIGSLFLDDDNASLNCSNDYCISNEDYINLIEAHIFPTTYEWVLIALHSVVFLAGLIGNALVCVAVYRNHSMRTVTNYFIVNLAVADFMVILFCLPPTVVWDVTETWFMGTALCKIVLYFQTVSVAVSVLTLTFISVDRWYAICFPLKFKSTTSRAKTAIFIIWLVALAFDIPELIVLQTQRKKELPIDTIFTQCVPTWSDKSEMTFHVMKTVLLYTVPLVFMSVAYTQIVRVLWRSDNIPGHTETMKYHSTTSCNNALTSSRRNTLNTNANTTTEGQLRSRRKAAKMLVAVVVMFAVCYFPVHLLSILRYTMDIPSSDVMVTIALLSHWLCYANSAVNPVIYNFMSGKFRREFKRTFLQSRCLYRNPSSPQSRHFNTRDKYQVSTASEYPMTTTVHPGSASTTMLRGECFLPTSGGSSMRQPGRRLLSNNNETSSSRL